MEFTVRITAETSIESLEDTIAMCTALLKMKRHRLNGPTSKGRRQKVPAATNPVTPIPGVPAAPPTQPNVQSDRQTARPAPVPFVPVRSDTVEPHSATTNKYGSPTAPVTLPSGERVLSAPVPVQLPAATSRSPFIPVPFADSK